MECWASLSLSNGRPVVAIGGALDLATVESIRETLTVVLSDLPDNDPRLIIDLRRLVFMDTSGIGLLIRVKHSCVAAGGDVSLVAPTPRVRRVLEKTNLLSIFTVCDDLSQATGKRTRTPKPNTDGGLNRADSDRPPTHPFTPPRAATSHTPKSATLNPSSPRSSGDRATVS